MKEYRYLGFDFRITDNVCLNNSRYLYEIDRLKPAGTRPFLTTIPETKEFIQNAVLMGYWLDGAGKTHPLPKN